MADSYTIVRERLRAAMDREPVSVTDLSQRTKHSEPGDKQGIDAKTIRRLLNKQGYRTKSRTIRLVAKALDVSPRYLCVELPESIDAPPPPPSVIEYINKFESRVADAAGVVGRAGLIEEIEAFLTNARCGTYLIHGKPGIGKSAVMAKFIRGRPGCIRHFIRRADNHCTPEECLQNVCAQLITACRLPYDKLIAQFRLPQGGALPDRLDDLRRLLDRALQKVQLADEENVVIAIDALDELDRTGLNPRDSNPLGLPNVPPRGVFFVLSSREETLKLTGMVPRLIEKEQADHKAAVREYIQKDLDRDQIRRILAKKKKKPADFAKDLEKKSEGNFMYLQCVLFELETKGPESPIDVDKLPAGLINYYKDHWDRLWKGTKMTAAAVEVLLCLTGLPGDKARSADPTLAVEAKPWPCDRLARVVGLKPKGVSGLLRNWRMFLESSNHDGVQFYSFYHKTYIEFVKEDLDIKTILGGFGMTIESFKKKVAERLFLEAPIP